MNAHDLELNKRLTRDFIAAIAHGDTAAILAAYADDGRVVTMGHTLISGTYDKPAIAAMAGSILEAFPARLRFTIHAMTAEEDRVAVEAESVGRHASGKHYNNHYHFLFRWRDGRLVELKEYMDTELVTEIICGGQKRTETAAAGSASRAVSPRDDLREIEQVMYRYAWMVDRRKWELMDSVFAPGATIDYTSTGGRKGAYRPTLEWLDRALAPWPINLHFISNISIELDGDRASSRCLFQAPMGRARADGSQEVITNAGYYFDQWVRTPAGWRISERVCEQNVMIGQLPAGYVIPE